MFRVYSSSRVVSGLCRSLRNSIGQRYQSSANVALEPNTSKMSVFSGHIKGAFTNNLEFIRPENLTPIPIYQVLTSDGTVADASQTPDVRKRLITIELIGFHLDEFLL